MPPAHLLRRAAGLAVLAAAWLPLHRLLAPGRTGLAGSTTRAAAEAAWTRGLFGSVVVLGAALLLARLVPPDGIRRSVAAATGRIAAASGARTALLAGAAAALGAALVAGLVFDGRPTSVDEMVQLLHARALLTGRPALPLPGPAAAWLVQNSVVTPAGWASVYPPFHTLALAVGLAVGRAWLVGPLALGVAVAFTVLSLRLLAPGRGGWSGWSGVAMALSPFLLLLGGTALSHTTAAALAAAVLWAALRAGRGPWRWSVATGALVGALVCTRPWTGIALGSVAAIVAVAGRPRPAGRVEAGRVAAAVRPGATRAVRVRAAGVALGGAPFAVLLLGWNAALFGHPLRLGYAAAYGPAHGLGLHDDPWGNAYGWVEALAYTAADLSQLGMVLLETPVPALAAVGLALLLAPTGRPGPGRVGAAWLAAGVVAAAAYWHHGIHFGPRLLYETAPMWVAAVVAAVATLAAHPTRIVRDAAVWAVTLCVLGAAVSAPSRLAVASGASGAAATVLPAPPAGPSLVFVHGSWASRVAATLVADGMRRDSVETLLRRNDLCRVRGYATWRASRNGPAPALERTPRPGSPPELRGVALSPGNVVLVDPARPPTAACLREAAADRRGGSLELEPLLWQAPPLPGAAMILARDMGPAGNAAVRAALPGRTAWVAVDGGPGRPPRVLPYAQGMEWLWGGAAGVTPAGE